MKWTEVSVNCEAAEGRRSVCAGREASGARHGRSMVGREIGLEGPILSELLD